MLRFSIVLTSLLLFINTRAQKADPTFTVIAYYSGDAKGVSKIPVEKLTHIIYSFCHLKGNRLNVDNAADTTTIKDLVELKKRNPKVKIMLSLGGWGGCKPCSDVFSTAAAREEFAKSVKELGDYFKTDGLDLDWEYPTIPGHPGHPYKAEDKGNFTELVKSLRKTLGKKQEISFAAGGFPVFLEQSVEWDKLAPLVDRVNLMTYDLVNGFSTVTGHHTPLYSTPQQTESTDQAVQYLKKIGFPANKIVIGAAFYARTWVNVEPKDNGLYKSGKFESFVPYHRFDTRLSAENGFKFYWDDTAKAPYAYSELKKTYATFDDVKSMKLKTQYALDQKLNGIMFWEMTLDADKNSLLDAIISETIK